MLNGISGAAGQVVIKIAQNKKGYSPEKECSLKQAARTSMRGGKASRREANSEEGEAPLDARTQSSNGGTAAGETCRRLSDTEETRVSICGGRERQTDRLSWGKGRRRVTVSRRLFPEERVGLAAVGLKPYYFGRYSIFYSDVYSHVS